MSTPVWKKAKQQNQQNQNVVPRRTSQPQHSGVTHGDNKNSEEYADAHEDVEQPGATTQDILRLLRKTVPPFTGAGAMWIGFVADVPPELMFTFFAIGFLAAAIIVD